MGSKKCNTLSRTDARSLVDNICCRCSLVNSIPRCHHNFRPDTFFKSGVFHLKRVPEYSRSPLAEKVITKLIDISEFPSNTALLCFLLSSLSCLLEKPSRVGESQRLSLNAIINKRIQDGSTEKNGNTTETATEKRVRSTSAFICTKLDEGIVEAAIRMAVGDAKIVDFTVDIDAALKVKHPKKKIILTSQISTVFQPLYSTSTRLSCPFLSALVQIWKDFDPNFEKCDCQVERANWTEFFQNLYKSCKSASRINGTFRTSTVLLWCEINCVERKTMETSSYRYMQYFSPIVTEVF